MEYIIENYKDKDIFLIGALDSLGVPYTIDNYKLYTCGGMNIRDALKIKSTMNFQDCKNVAHEVMFHAMDYITQTKREVKHCICYIKSLNLCFGSICNA